MSGSSSQALIPEIPAGSGAQNRAHHIEKSDCLENLIDGMWVIVLRRTGVVRGRQNEVSKDVLGRFFLFYIEPECL